ncbi:slipin family protein, partial [Microcoleus anatoxicus PTRS2]
DESLELPAEFVQKVRSLTLQGLKKFQISEYELGLLYVQNNFVRPLESGEYAVWSVVDKDVTVRTFSRVIPNPEFPQENVLIEKHPDFVATYCEFVQLLGNQIAIVRDRGKVIAFLPPTSRKLFWQGVEVEIIDINTHVNLHPS